MPESLARNTTTVAPDARADRDSWRERMITEHLPLAHALARRLCNRGEAHDDLVQVACVGLIKAVDRFDYRRGVEFRTFASSTILGELKRHFRDHGWSVRVPRRLQELTLEVSALNADLAQEKGRQPTCTEIAEAAQVSEHAVREAAGAALGYRSVSLDAPTFSADGEDLGSTIGQDDPGIAVAESRASLATHLCHLPERERTVIHLRFVRDMTQDQIARSIGVSQMHVSRILSTSLSKIRSAMTFT